MLRAEADRVIPHPAFGPPLVLAPRAVGGALSGVITIGWVFAAACRAGLTEPNVSEAVSEAESGFAGLWVAIT